MTAELEQRLREAAEKATQVKDIDLMRYGHGGGRLAIMRDGDRTLVADFYQEGDTEFYGLCSPENILALLEALSTERARSEGLERAEQLVREARDVLLRVQTYAPDVGVDEFLDAIHDARLLIAKIDGAE